MKTQIGFTVVFALVYWLSAPAFADYTLVLKNGRRITVQSYREENGLIKFNGMGGEIGISKDQIQDIRAGDSGTPGDLNLTHSEPPSRSAVDAPTPAQEGAAAKTTPAEEERAKEEKEYLEKIKNLTEQLKVSQDRYSEAIRGTSGSDPSQLVTEEQVKARQNDIDARFKDAQSNPSEPVPVKLLTPSPFTSLPPTVTEVQPNGRTVSPYEPAPTFTEKERELLGLRNQSLEIEKERERLINEMRQKNLDPGPSLGQ